jgi:arylformamidase
VFNWENAWKAAGEGSDPSFKIIDISPVLSARTAVFPGDQAFERSVVMDFPLGHSYALSSVRTTVHVGAHTDAPSHYHPQGRTIDQRELERYLGPCQVMWVDLPRGARILPEHLGNRPIHAERVLFRTGSFPDPDLWNGDFNSLSPALVDYLADRGVTLVGIDTPSVDPADSKGLESHNRIHERDLAILEGVILKSVAEGLYTLIALPLRIEGGDASPVRAVLLETKK